MVREQQASPPALPHRPFPTGQASASREQGEQATASRDRNYSSQQKHMQLPLLQQTYTPQTYSQQMYPQQTRPQQLQASRLPPQTPQKPAVLSKRDAAQRKQIEKDGEDLTFDKHDIIIAVMGVTGAGKSTFISLLSDAEIKIGHGLKSCTTAVGVYHFMLNGVRVWLIDTPGFDDTNRSDAEVLKDIAFWLAAAYTKNTQLAGILYLHRITEPRFQGSAKRNLRMFQQLCGTKNLNSVILATTHWSDKEGKRYPEEEGRRKVKELIETEEFWGGMVARGSRVERHDGTKDSARKIISTLVDRQIRVILDIQKQLIDQNKSLDDTDAGQALQSELIEERQKSEARLADLKLDMEFALKEKDVKWQREIENDRARFEADIRKGYEQTKELETNMKKMAEEKEAQIRAMEAKMEEDRKLYQEQMKKSTEQIEAIRTEQRIKEAAYQRERREAEQKAERVAAEHRQKLAAEEQRIRAENDRERRAELAREKQEIEARFAREREEARVEAEERRREWEDQQEEYRRQQAELVEKREEDRIEMERLALEARKSRAFLLSAITAVSRVVSGVITLGLAVTGFGPGFGSF